MEKINFEEITINFYQMIKMHFSKIQPYPQKSHKFNYRLSERLIC